MATKAQAEEIVEVAPPKVSTKVEKKEPTKPSWEVKDRIYFLKTKDSPLTLTIPSKHTKKHALLWFDPKNKKQRELRYATNQDSPIVDEQNGEVTMGHIVFKDGELRVPKEMKNLQQLLSLYHPLRERIYYEFSAIAVANTDLDELEIEIDALNAARTIEIDHAEAILRVEKGSMVDTMSSREVKRDLLLFAKSDPKMFLSLIQDENVQLRNIAIKAQEAGVIILSQDQRTFTWGSNNRKLMNVPFDENPYSAFAAFLKTDEGVEIYKSIDKKLK